MTKKAKILSSVIGLLVLVPVFVWVGVYTNVIKLPIVREIGGSALRPPGFGTTDFFIHDSDNIFTGRVVKQVGSEPNDFGMTSTQFSVEVISNIKGDLKGSVIVNQEGGYKHGVFYISAEDYAIADTEGKVDPKKYLLQPGSTYLFAAIYNPKSKHYSVESKTYYFITDNKTLNAGQLKSAASENSKVQEFMKAAGVTELK